MDRRRHKSLPYHGHNHYNLYRCASQPATTNIHIDTLALFRTGVFQAFRAHAQIPLFATRRNSRKVSHGGCTGRTPRLVQTGGCTGVIYTHMGTLSVRIVRGAGSCETAIIINELYIGSADYYHTTVFSRSAVAIINL